MGRYKISSIEAIPRDLILEILSRVATSSITDIINIKLSSKKLKEIAEDKSIYRCVSLDKIPITRWEPLNQDLENFLDKCRRSGNPEIMYRSALVDYFNKTDLISAYKKLHKAVKLGNMGALYLTCIVLLLSGDEEYKQKGIKMICNMKKSPPLKRKLKLCRKNLIEQIKSVWVNNQVLKELPRYCTTQHLHRGKNPWNEEDDDDDDTCEGCSVDREIKFTL